MMRNLRELGIVIDREGGYSLMLRLFWILLIGVPVLLIVVRLLRVSPSTAANKKAIRKSRRLRDDGYDAHVRVVKQRNDMFGHSTQIGHDRSRQRQADSARQDASRRSRNW